MTDLANLDMSEFWNGDGGKNWMRFQSRLESSLLPFGQQAITVANIKKGEQVLDIGCGWGDTSFQISKSVGASGKVLGIDISDLILQQARTRVDALEFGNVSFECVDAEYHQFDSMKFDVLYSRFGVMFFNDPVAAFINLRRALHSNARMVFICWQSVNANQWVSLPKQIAEKYVAMNDAVNPEAPGGFAFGDPQRVSKIIEDAGFININIESYETTFTVGQSLDEAVNFLSHVGPTGLIIDDLDIKNSTKKNILDDLRSTLKNFKNSKGIELNAATWIVTADNH